MYTREQVKKLQSVLDDLQRTEQRFHGLQSLIWLTVDFGTKNSKVCDLPISTDTVRKIKELLLAEYASRVKALQDEVENTTIINTSKF